MRLSRPLFLERLVSISTLAILLFIPLQVLR